MEEVLKTQLRLWWFKKGNSRNQKHLKANASHVVKLTINQVIVGSRRRKRNLEVILLIMKKRKEKKARTSHLKRKD